MTMEKFDTSKFLGVTHFTPRVSFYPTKNIRKPLAF